MYINKLMYLCSLTHTWMDIQLYRLSIFLYAAPMDTSSFYTYSQIIVSLYIFSNYCHFIIYAHIIVTVYIFTHYLYFHTKYSHIIISQSFIFLMQRRHFFAAGLVQSLESVMQLLFDVFQFILKLYAVFLSLLF